MFQDTVLYRTTFESSDLSRSDFTGADLQGVNFKKADLSFANFKDALIDESTNFYGADLKGVKNLPVNVNLTGARNVLHESLRELNDFVDSISYPPHRNAARELVHRIIQIWKTNYKKRVVMLPGMRSRQVSLDTDAALGGRIRYLFGRYANLGHLHIGDKYHVKANFERKKGKEFEGELVGFNQDHMGEYAKLKIDYGDIESIPIYNHRHNHLFTITPVTPVQSIPCYEIDRAEFGTISFDNGMSVVNYNSGEYEEMPVEALYDGALKTGRILTIPHPNELRKT